MTTDQSSDQQQELSQLLGDLKSLKEHPGRKFLVNIMNNTRGDITDQIMTGRTDQTLRRNSDHLLKERFEVLGMVISSLEGSIKELEMKFESMTESDKTMTQRLEEMNKKLGEEIKQKMGLN